MKFRASTMFLSAVLSLAAHADNGNLTSELKVWSVVKQADGAETLQPAQTVKPGDMLQYVAVYMNSGHRPVTRLLASLPIPAGTELVGASAVPREVQASIDGKVYAAVPLLRKARRADGQLVDVPVPLAEYRHLRWPEQQVAAGASFTTSARVRVVSASAATPTATSAARSAATPATTPAASSASR